MERYDYYQAVKDDVLSYVHNELDLADWRGREDELEEDLFERLWADDSVTGNGSGSYTFSSWEAEENICHNMDLLEEACIEFGDDFASNGFDAERADVTIRCYLLPSVIAEVVAELDI